MSLVDDLIENLVERNAIDVRGTFTVVLVDGGVTIKGVLNSTVRDEKKKKEILKLSVPVDARVGISEIVIPLPQIK